MIMLKILNPFRCLPIMANPAFASDLRALTIEDAVAAHRAGRLTEAERVYQAIVEANPRHFDALHLLGVVWTQQARYDEAVAVISRALKRNPRSFDAHYNLGNALNALGRHKDAAASFRRALELNPKHPLANNNLGVALQDSGRTGDAIAAFRRALAVDANYAEAHFNLARALASQGRYDDAVAGYRRALTLKPDYIDAYINLGAVLEALTDYGEAAECLRRALSLRPDSVEALNNLSIVLRALAQYDESIKCLERALSINPQFAEAHNNLANVLKDARRYDEAVLHYRQAISINADYAEAWSNLGTALGLLNQYEEAIACYRRALAIKPDFPEAHSYLIFTLDFLPGSGFADQQAERARWYEAHASRFASAIEPHANSRDSNRRLKIGYVSADFRRHSAVFAIGPIIRHHDRSNFDVILYSGVKVGDEVTQAFQRQATLWRRIAGLSDDALAEQIRADGIDILIDLSGHTEGNRLLTFARKPAPVQMTGWGHALGTGVRAVDYFLADPVSVPAEVRPLFAETVIDLPAIIGYEAPAYAPEISPLPALSGQPLTFGSFNRVSKLTPASLGVWSRLLQAVPKSRLLLKDSQLSDPGERRRITEVLGSYEIDPSRLLLLPGTSHAEHLAAYGQMDIALDPFPTNGGITTAEALWMGVPVVALLGSSVASRASAGILSGLGLKDWIATTEEDYIALAARHAADYGALSVLRGQMRAMMGASPVGNPDAYCRAVEAAYRAAWQSYCRGGTGAG